MASTTSTPHVTAQGLSAAPYSEAQTLHASDASAASGLKAVSSGDNSIATLEVNTQLLEGDSHFSLSPACSRLPVGMAVAIPVREFRVRNLLTMAPGEVIGTQWANGEDLPLNSGDVQLAWSEFEVVDTRLAVRITRLA
ncbi:FliM/FliN family flagellar motor C-terminal domain-containing protein [Acidicapsa ligni]|uniref:FliM/FliN family flagellar motor C-terminal domain-containing protein n=1 Tax=Acidicapsa ligni TaxID=542300 RepID=UPI0021E0E5D7|nr:FliM/FliN family flagellar motor C-terminal domain-containing protein [Acidicapsa ligni]